MKRAVFVHGWYGHPTDGWWPWLKTELENQGYEVIAPQMPDTESPQVDNWVHVLDEVVGNPTPDTYLVGHSLGCITILRYLESLNDGGEQKVGGAVLVAGFAEDLAFDGYNGALANFFTKPLGLKQIRSHCPKFWLISSDNDPTVTRDNHARLKEYLDAHETWEHNKKHLTGDDGIFELQSAVNAVNALSQS